MRWERVVRGRRERVGKRVRMLIMICGGYQCMFSRFEKVLTSLGRLAIPIGASDAILMVNSRDEGLVDNDI